MNPDILRDTCKKCGGTIYKFTETGLWSHTYFTDFDKCSRIASERPDEKDSIGGNRDCGRGSVIATTKELK